MDYTAAEYHALEKHIAELEAQEMGFIQSLCSQSEDIGRLKQRIAALEEDNKAQAGRLSIQYERIAELEAGIKYHVKEYGHRDGCLHNVRKCSCGISKLAALLLGSGE